MQYEPNSHKYRDSVDKKGGDSEEPKKSKAHVRTHQSVGQRFKEAFFSEALRDVIDYIFNEVLIPSLKELVREFIEVWLFGTRDRYDGYYRRSSIYDRDRDHVHELRRERREATRTRRRKLSISSIEFETRSEAASVLNQMNEYCRKYGVCSVSAFYDFIDCDRPDDWTHDRWGWGWNELDRARVIRKSNGWYAIDIAEPDTYID